MHRRLRLTDLLRASAVAVMCPVMLCGYAEPGLRARIAAGLEARRRVGDRLGDRDQLCEYRLLTVLLTVE